MTTTKPKKAPAKKAAPASKAPAEDVEMADPAPAKATGSKRAPAEAAKPAKKEAAKKPRKSDAPPASPAAAPVGSGRQAAQGITFKDKRVHLQSKSDLVAVKEEARASSEAEALADTRGEGAAGAASRARRVGDFLLADAGGAPEPLGALAFAKRDLFLSGVVYPADGPANKATGRRVERVGPVTGFSLDLAAKEPTVLVATPAASYAVLRPAAGYKKYWDPLAAQAAVAHEVHRALAPAAGGAPTASLEEVVARLARSGATRGFATPREGLLLNGRFVLAQLAAADAAAAAAGGAANAKGKAAADAGAALAESDFARALGEALKDFRYVGGAAVGGAPGGVTIARDAASRPASGAPSAAASSAEAAAQMEADEEFARALQARMDVDVRSRAAAAARPRPSAPGGAAYIKVSEAEIAEDYPQRPVPYAKEEEEADELLLADEDAAGLDPEDLPRRLLADFSIYNADGLLAPLELVPMWAGVDPDVELYASGAVLDDDGDYGAGGQALEGGAGGSSAPAAAAGGSSAAAAGGSAAAPAPAGMRLYLSQIREWVVEFGADMLFISIRTDVAWYRLTAPAAAYAPWWATVLRASRVGAAALRAVAQEKRASKLSFGDVVRRLADLDEGAGAFVSKKLPVIERFMIVHGQIILSMFRQFPVKEVARSAFAAALAERMSSVRHSRLYRGTAAPEEPVAAAKGRRANRNPMKDRAAGGRSKPMTATATKMVRSVWQSYFKVGGPMRPDGEDAPAAEEVADDENEDEADDDDVAEDALAAAAAAKRRAAPRAKAAKLAWAGAPLPAGRAGPAAQPGDKYYSAAAVGDLKVALGDVVELAEGAESDGEGDDEADAAAGYGLVQALWQDADGAKRVQVRVLVPATETVLGDAGSESELFLTTRAAVRPLADVAAKPPASRLVRPWDSARRTEYAAADAALRAANEAAAAEGRPVTLFWRHEYVPEEGMFRAPPADLGLGARLPPPAKVEKGARALAGATPGFVKDGVEYRAGDFFFVGPTVFEQAPGARREVTLPSFLKGKFHKGSHEGLRAWGIAQLVALGPAPAAKKGAAPAAAPPSDKKAKKAPTPARRGAKGKAAAAESEPESEDDSDDAMSEDEAPARRRGAAGKGRKGAAPPMPLTVRRYWRPEDISADKAYEAASYRDVYAGDDLVTVDAADVVGACRVVPAAAAPGIAPTDVSTFVCVGKYDAGADAFGPAPKLPVPADVAAKAAAADKGKAAKGKAAAAPPAGGVADGVSLATMDIFAGCGGLSEGMHQAGAAHTKWAIEYEAPAAEAFRLNNPDAWTFCNNCNVLLRAAMDKAGATDCEASPEAVEAAAALDAADRDALPAPGEVDFICGGPPCQGYSGMNRFNKGNWSMVQNSMVMSFLSYADFYRPRYFLLENVRNFVSHNKSFTFRLTLRTLLDMGYQVRFGVLNAGNFGVAQSRKRTFIWAAAPSERLPSWPRLAHAFRTPQLTINLPGGVAYTAVPTAAGAPYRPVTVRDAIGDLPPIENGHDVDDMPYGGPPRSVFQRASRGDCTRLVHHISKQMNELNLERCRCIPKNCPGADWRCLEEIVAADPSREKFKGQALVPWCLPNTADRHNGWRGLFGRLDWAGHFPTSTTDPQPMGKVGQVFHPEQDRIVSVRECARAQGFPDRTRFSGNVHSKHRQVGNAVPPPLAAALGRELRAALEATKAAADA